MVVKAYREIKIQASRRAMIEQCNTIITDYQAQGLRLTLRQLYYQLVSRALIPNVERSYKNLSSTVSDARLAGLMDWDAIEDRGRVAQKHSEWDDLEDLVDAALRSYRLPRWKTQSNYVELWVEKQALAGVLEPLADQFHATLMVNKGYSSQSAMYESARRIKAAVDPTKERIREIVGELGGRSADQAKAQKKVLAETKQATVLYLGDHDPSGEDMVRDVRERLEMFGCWKLDVRKIALTMEQIEEHDPPRTRPRSPTPGRRPTSPSTGSRRGRWTRSPRTCSRT